MTGSDAPEAVTNQSWRKSHGHRRRDIRRQQRRDPFISQVLEAATDFGTMIDSLVAVEQTRVTTYQTWQQTWADKVTAFQALNTQLLSLRTSLQSMDTISEFLQKSASSSDSDVVSATASGTADAGVLHLFRAATGQEQDDGHGVGLLVAYPGYQTSSIPRQSSSLHTPGSLFPIRYRRRPP